MASSSENQPVEAAVLDETIGKMERLYHAMTGREVPAGETPFAPIPVERDPGEYIEEQMSRLAGLLGETGRAASRTPSWVPPMTICDSGTELVVRIDLPGVAREQVELTANGKVLTVSGTRPAPAPGDGTVRLAESAAGPFQRTLVLPEGARGTDPAARMKDGVLEIRIPREAGHGPNPKSVRIN